MPASWGRIIHVPEPVGAMKPASVCALAPQRTIRAGKHRNIGVAKFDSVQRVDDTLLEWNISTDHRDRRHAHQWIPQRHDQCDGIVGSGVGVDQESARHG